MKAVRQQRNERIDDSLGLSAIQNGELFCKSHYVINQVFGHKGFLLDYIASHIEAGVYEEFDGIPYFYHSSLKIADRLNVSRSQVCRWIEFFKGLGILTVKKFSKTFNVNYMAINRERLGVVISERINIVKRICDPNTPEQETNKLLMVKEEMLVEEIQEHSESLRETEKREVAASNILGAIASNRLKNTYIPKEMVDCWNEIFNVNVVLNPDLSRNLVAAFKAKFHSDLDVCRSYFENVFNLKVKRTLDEALSYRFIDKIMAYVNKNNGVNYINSNKNGEEKVNDEDIKRERSRVQESLECIMARNKIAEEIGEAFYRSWFSRSKFSFKDGVLTITAPNDFTKERMLSMYSDTLSRLFSSVRVV